MMRIAPPRAVGLIQKYAEAGQESNLAQTAIADEDYPVLFEMHDRWDMIPPASRNRDNLRAIVQSGCDQRAAMNAVVAIEHNAISHVARDLDARIRLLLLQGRVDFAGVLRIDHPAHRRDFLGEVDFAGGNAAATDDLVVPDPHIPEHREDLLRQSVRLPKQWPVCPVLLWRRDFRLRVAHARRM